MDANRNKKTFKDINKLINQYNNFLIKKDFIKIFKKQKILMI